MPSHITNLKIPEYLVVFKKGKIEDTVNIKGHNKWLAWKKFVADNPKYDNTWKCTSIREKNSS